MLNKRTLYTVRIHRYAWGGKGVTYLDGRPIFVPQAVPGQICEVKLKKIKPRYGEGRIVRVLAQSPVEVETGYQAIPGAPYATVPVEHQQQWKRAEIGHLFRTLAGVEIEQKIEAVVSSPETWGYRNKMEYSFGPTDEHQDEEGVWCHTGFGLGSKKRGSFWLVESLETPSGVFDEGFERLLPIVRAWCESTGLAVYNQRTQQGVWRTLLVRKSFAEDAFLVAVMTTSGLNVSLEPLVEILKEALGGRLKGVFHTVSDAENDATASAQQKTLLWGEPTLEEALLGERFTVSLTSFFQPNPAAAEKLYARVAAYASGDRARHVLDLCCGTGTIGQLLAAKSPDVRVTGVDIVPSAIEDAQKNAAVRGLGERTEWICADLKKWVREETFSEGPYTIVLDPPRSGIAPKVLDAIVRIPAERLVYVSCNPTTMARDTEKIVAAGYRLEAMTLVDQFPHTAHMECVGKFVRPQVS